MLTAPTRQEFTDRYPSFASASPALINALLQEALGAVDETWIEQDRKPALLAYAAHLLAVELYGNPVLDLGNGQAMRVSGPLSSAEVGPAKASFADGGSGSSGGASGASADSLASTTYGQRYLQLLRRNKPPVLVV